MLELENDTESVSVEVEAECGDERRTSFRCPVQGAAEAVILRTRRADLMVRVVEKSAGGFGVVAPPKVPLEVGQAPDAHNRFIEQLVDDLGGRKSLYSTSSYEPEHFWRLYNGPVYEVLKKTYDPDGRLLDLYAKCVKGQ